MSRTHRIAISMFAAIAGLLTVGGTASAQEYPPTTDPAPTDIEVSEDVIVPGQSFTVTVYGCTPGESVLIELITSDGDTAASETTTCQSSSAGIAVAEFDGDLPVGTYRVVATGDQGFYAEDRIQVVSSTPSTTAPAGGGGTLPTTGGDSTGTLTMAATALVLTGAGILIVARLRRRPALG